MADSNLNLQAFREQRDTAIKARMCWDCSIETFLEAYEQGERDFRYANLNRADLSDADLRYANLSDANLNRADLSDNFSVFQCGPVGSRKAYVTATSNDGVQEICTGCFRGTLAEFVAAVERKPDGDQYRIEYETIVIPALQAFFALHEVEKETSE